EPVLRALLDYGVADKPWLKFYTQSLLGASLAGQRKYAEAEPWLLAGYEGLKAGEAQIPMPQRKRVTEAVERVAKFYQDWDKLEQAAQWRKKREEEKQLHARRDTAIVHYDRGKALAKRGDPAGAEAAFRRAVRLEPAFAEAHAALGDILCYHRRDSKGAVAAFREAVRLEPKGATHRCNLGNALCRLGKPAEAAPEDRQALR